MRHFAVSNQRQLRAHKYFTMGVYKTVCGQGVSAGANNGIRYVYCALDEKSESQHTKKGNVRAKKQTSSQLPKRICHRGFHI